MKNDTNLLSYLNKPAGLESHQFSRDEHRFNTVFQPPQTAKLPRVPRVGQNTRNHSDLVFKFGNSQGFNSEKDRFGAVPVCEIEKHRQDLKKAKIQNRMALKREWLSQIEHERWNQMAIGVEKEQHLLETRQKNSKRGSSSVSYNPITLEYLSNDAGKKLLQEDAKAKHRLAIRAARLYEKNNTFDPTLCVDIPHITAITVDEKCAGLKSKIIAKHGRRKNDDPCTTAKLLSNMITTNQEAVMGLTGEDPSKIFNGNVRWVRNH
ncbi:hypothetical protein HDV01_002117 [Terramyces sp. JEL0728]|nr:hypothetical protein HDV01_002117 [Terramyces sp. JEL0728]